MSGSGSGERRDDRARACHAAGGRRRGASGAGRRGHHRVVRRGGSSRVDPREAEQQTGREVHDARELVLTRAGAARDQPERDAERDERLGGTEVEARPPAPKRLGGVPEAPLAERRDRELGQHRGGLDRAERPAGRVAVRKAARDEREAGRGRTGGGRRGDECRPEDRAAARPQRDRGAREQHAGVGAEVAAEQRGQRSKRAGGLWPPDQVRRDRQRARAAEGDQAPGARVHRRARLEDPHHVQESLGTAEIGDQQDRRRARRPRARPCGRSRRSGGRRRRRTRARRTPRPMPSRRTRSRSRPPSSTRVRG